MNIQPGSPAWLRSDPLFIRAAASERGSRFPPGEDVERRRRAEEDRVEREEDLLGADGTGDERSPSCSKETGIEGERRARGGGREKKGE